MTDFLTWRNSQEEGRERGVPDWSAVNSVQQWENEKAGIPLLYNLKLDRNNSVKNWLETPRLVCACIYPRERKKVLFYFSVKQHCCLKWISMFRNYLFWSIWFSCLLSWICYKSDMYMEKYINHKGRLDKGQDQLPISNKPWSWLLLSDPQVIQLSLSWAFSL